VNNENVFAAIRGVHVDTARVGGFIDPSRGIGWFVSGPQEWRARILKPIRRVVLRTGSTTDLNAPLPGRPERYVLIPLHANEVRGFGYWSGREVSIEACRRAVQELAARLDAEETFQHLSDLANNDPLTGLPNKRAFEREAVKRLSTRQRVYLTFLDMNGLKAINDTLGHQAGDKAIATIGNVLKESLRKGDYASRWAGDEFSLVTDSDPLPLLARIEEKLALHKLTASAGYVVVPDEAADYESAIALADKRMYAAKQAKKQAQAADGAPEVLFQPEPERRARAVPEPRRTRF
jgi:diguanylate cyclase (GGDEF)-like protein